MATNVPLAVIDVLHHGKTKMVGVLFNMRAEAPDGTSQGFLHSHKGNQYHRDTECPCPIDEAALYLLRDLGLSRVYCYDEDAGIMRKSTVATILDALAFAYDGRTRHCLPEREWERLTDVQMTRALGGGRNYTHAERGLIMTVPYVQPHLLAKDPEGF